MRKIISFILSIIIMSSFSGISNSNSTDNAETPTNQSASVKSIFTNNHIIHKYRFVESKEPTCENIGYNKYECCVCGKINYIYKMSENHKIVVDSAVEATCISKGLSEGKHCSVCKKVLKEQYETDFLDCDVITEIIPATKDQDGKYREYCKNCDYEYSKTIYMPEKIYLYLTKDYINEFEYTGEKITPYVKVVDRFEKTIPSSCYEVKYSNNIDVGTATVTVSFYNDEYNYYAGSMVTTFEIKNKLQDSTTDNNTENDITGSSIIKIINGIKKKSVQIYHTIDKNAIAYEFQYAVNSGFSNANTVTIKSKNNGSFCISNITLNVTDNPVRTERSYFFRVRSVDNKGNKSEWSDYKSINIYIQ